MSSSRTHVIVNPVAGRGRALRTYKQLQSRLADTHPDSQASFTTGPGHAANLAEVAVRDGADRLICFGGDGTIHEIMGSLVHTPVALGVVPTGTGNDLARTLGISTDPAVSLSHFNPSREPLVVDAATVNGHYFINVAGAGFDAEVANQMNTRLKRFHGTVPFVLAAISMLFNYRNSEITIEHDEGIITGKSLLVAVANGRYYGGGMQIAPNADPADGLLDIVVAGEMGRLEILRTLPMVYSGAHMKKSNVIAFRTRTVSLSSPDTLYIQADGEIVGQLPAVCRIVPGALRIYGPEGG